MSAVYVSPDLLETIAFKHATPIEVGGDYMFTVVDGVEYAALLARPPESSHDARGYDRRPVGGAR